MIAGSADQAVPPEVSARAVDRLPHAKLHMVEGAGHLLHEERPDFVAGLIRDHLASDLS